MIAAYIQSLSLYLLEERPHSLNQNLYYLYKNNRFQASRYGFDGEIVDPYTLQRINILDDTLETVKKIEKYANDLDNMAFISQMMQCLIDKQNDASFLRELKKQVGSFPELVREQCMMWEKN